MDIDEAIQFLDPETTANAIEEVEYYGGFNGRKKAIEKVNESCDIAVAIMESYQKIQSISDIVSKKENLSYADLKDVFDFTSRIISSTSEQIKSIDSIYTEKEENQDEDPER